jgi:putative phosphoribosyl transferase
LEKGMNNETTPDVREYPVRIPAGRVALEGDLRIPSSAKGLVIFAHGSGSSRHSPRNQSVAQVLQSAGLATLLFDLLTTMEEKEDLATGHLRFNIPFLAERLVAATDWALSQKNIHQLAVGYFGASTGAAAALAAAASRPDVVKAIVSRGGRPDLAGRALPLVKAPTLLIVGGRDTPVIGMNQEAMALLQAEKKLVIVPGATHLFEEYGTLGKVSSLAADWFKHYLNRHAPPAA